MLTPLYRSLIAWISGCSRCIFFMLFMLVIFSGSVTKLMAMVRTMIDQPKLCR